MIYDLKRKNYDDCLITGATFILRWSCFIIIKTLIIFAIHSHSHCTNADLFPAYHQPPQAPVLHLRAQIGAILSTVLCRWTPLYFVIVFRIWISSLCLIWFIFCLCIFSWFFFCLCIAFAFSFQICRSFLLCSCLSRCPTFCILFYFYFAFSCSKSEKWYSQIWPCHLFWPNDSLWKYFPICWNNSG